MRAGPTPNRVARCSDRTGSNIDKVAARMTTVAAHRATAGVRTTIGALRPVRSDSAPAGIEMVSRVMPNDAKRNPMTVGDAPRRRLRSGRTGIATAYATMSVKVAKTTRAAATARADLRDITTK